MSNDSVFGFDFESIESETKKGGVLPAGDYTVIVDRALLKPNSKKTGFLINLVMKVCDMKKYNNATVFDNLNIKNESEKAQEIGRGRLKRMLELSGVPADKMKDAGPADLVAKKFKVYLSIEKSVGYDDRNKVCSYSEISGHQPTSAEIEGTKKENQPSWC